jgi:hypothetical protein
MCSTNIHTTKSVVWSIYIASSTCTLKTMAETSSETLELIHLTICLHVLGDMP